MIVVTEIPELVKKKVYPITINFMLAYNYTKSTVMKKEIAFKNKFTWKFSNSECLNLVIRVGPMIEANL